MSRSRILILGHGAMGRMFENLLAPHWQVSHWDRDLDTGEETEHLESLAPGHELIIFALPAHPHDELAGRLAACLPGDALCLSIAKGLDADGHSPAEVFARHFGTEGPIAWALIHGSMIARDLHAGRKGFALAAAPEMAMAQRVLPWFRATDLHLEASDDPVGCAWSAILKNVYVPLIGMAEQLELGDNMRGFLVCEALAELARIVASRGGRPETAYSLSGLGDLVTTATSTSSHHRRIGEDLAAGNKESVQAAGGYIRSEGVNTARMVMQYGILADGDYPLFSLTAALLEDPRDIGERIEAYISERFQPLVADDA